MTFAEQLFLVLANARTKAGGVLTKDQWLAEANTYHASWLSQNTPVKPQKPRLKAQTESEWLSALSKAPEFAGINISAEMILCRRWCAARTPPCKMSRRRFGNWLVHARGDAALQPPSPKVVIEAEPAGWRLFMADNYPAFDHANRWERLHPHQRIQILKLMATPLQKGA